jgi:hypothetical protein
MEKISVSGEIRVSHPVSDGTVTIKLDGQSYLFPFQYSSDKTTLRYPGGELLLEIFSGADVSHLNSAQVVLTDMVFFLSQQLYRAWRMGSSAAAQLAVNFGAVSFNSGNPTTLGLTLPADKEQARLLREAIASLKS